MRSHDEDQNQDRESIKWDLYVKSDHQDHIQVVKVEKRSEISIAISVLGKGYRFRGVFDSTRPQLAPSRPSLSPLQDCVARGLGCDGYEVDGLLLNEPGEDGTDEPGVVLAVDDSVVGFDRLMAAVAGLQCGQVKMV